MPNIALVYSNAPRGINEVAVAGPLAPTTWRAIRRRPTPPAPTPPDTTQFFM